MAMATYIRGRLNQACCDLVDNLKELGIDAAVGHWGSSKKGLIVRPRRREDLDKIPKTWCRLPVTVEMEPLETDAIKTPSALVTEICGLLQKRRLPENAIAGIKEIIEAWEDDPAEFTSAKDGFLMVGVDPELRNVVVDLGRDRTGHINFTADQARQFAGNLLNKANELDGMTTGGGR